MVYTEIQKKGKNSYFYRTVSKRVKGQVKKARIYLGSNLSYKEKLNKENEADIKLGILNSLLSNKEKEQLINIRQEYKKKGKKEFDLKYEAFISKFTYDSNAIEGNTLTLQETSSILFDNITPEGKSPREVNEAINHKKAFDFIIEYKGDINKEFICKIQGLITLNTVKKEYEDQIGKYRHMQVYIRGAEFVPPKAEEVEKEMSELLRWHNINKRKLHPIILASYFHSGFESIHPFIDGNGRTGRLLINFILHRNGFPMINIPVKERIEYYNSLDESRKGDLRKLIKIIINKLMTTIDRI